MVLSGGRYRFCPILQPIQVIEYCNPLLFSYLRNRNYPLKSSPEIPIINSLKVAPDQVRFCGFYSYQDFVFFRSLNRRWFYEAGRPESPRGKALATTPCAWSGWGSLKGKPFNAIQTSARALFYDKLTEKSRKRKPGRDQRENFSWTTKPPTWFHERCYVHYFAVTSVIAMRKSLVAMQPVKSAEPSWIVTQSSPILPAWLRNPVSTVAI